MKEPSGRDERRMVSGDQADLSLALVSLFRGVIYHADQPHVWQALLRVQPFIRDHVALFGLCLTVDEAEGYAFLRQGEPGEGDEEPELPRLVSRRQLTYAVSLLLALLRKKLAEHDASGADPRLILTKDQIADLVRLFLPETADEVRFLRRIETDINRVVDLGFLRRLRGRNDHYEVLRILAAFVDAQWLSGFDDRLAEYSEHAAGAAEE